MRDDQKNVFLWKNENMIVKTSKSDQLKFDVAQPASIVFSVNSTDIWRVARDVVIVL